MKSVLDHLLTDKVKAYIEKNNKAILAFKKKNYKSVSSQLERITRNEFELDSKRIFYSGDILKRPLESFERGQHAEMCHFGIVLGEGKKSEKLPDLILMEGKYRCPPV